MILKNGLFKIINNRAIGQSDSYPCGWITIEDLREIVDMIDNGEYDKFGNYTKKNE